MEGAPGAQREGVAGQLLGDGAGALLAPARVEQVAGHRAADGLEVQRVVLVEALVLPHDDGVAEILRHVLQGHDGAVDVLDAGVKDAVRVEHLRTLGNLGDLGQVVAAGHLVVNEPRRPRGDGGHEEHEQPGEEEEPENAPQPGARLPRLAPEEPASVND